MPVAEMSVSKPFILRKEVSNFPLKNSVMPNAESIQPKTVEAKAKARIRAASVETRPKKLLTKPFLRPAKAQMINMAAQTRSAMYPA